MPIFKTHLVELNTIRAVKNFFAYKYLLFSFLGLLPNISGIKYFCILGIVLSPINTISFFYTFKAKSWHGVCHFIEQPGYVYILIDIMLQSGWLGQVVSGSIIFCQRGCQEVFVTLRDEIKGCLSLIWHIC